MDATVDATAATLTFVESRFGRVLSGRCTKFKESELSTVSVFERDGSAWDLWPFVRLPKRLLVKQYHQLRSWVSNKRPDEVEEEIYQKLRRHQGATVPYYYGRVRLNEERIPALAFQYLDGQTLWQFSGAEHAKRRAFKTEHITRQMDDIINMLSQYEVVHGDLDPDKLDNLMLVETPDWHAYCQFALAAAVGVGVGAAIVGRVPYSLEMMVAGVFLLVSLATYASLCWTDLTGKHI